MLTPRASFAVLLQRGLAGTGLVAVLLLTVVDRGATRMYATPWQLLLSLAELSALLLLLLRLASTDAPVRLPSRPWAWLAAAAAGVVFVCALTSRYRAPSLALTLLPLAAIASFLLIHDWLEADPVRNPGRLQSAIAGASALVMAVGVGRWVIEVTLMHRWADIAWLAGHRNDHPLGHSNYTAGLALLALPWVAAQAWQTRGARRMGWIIATLLSLVLLVSSGSRGGMLALCAVLVTALYHLRPNWRILLFAGAGACAFAAGLIALNPRTRTLLLRRARAGVELNASTVQRTAMLQAGWRMGADRPVLGWGPGVTPLVYPQYRAGLDGGVEDALELHDTPVQIWADCGIVGILVAGAFLALAMRATLRHRGAPFVVPASIAVTGYVAFSLFDFQLDVPVFPLALAAAAAVLAAADTVEQSVPISRRTVLPIAAILMAVVVLGGRDPTPEWNVRALELARDPAGRAEAIRLLRESLRSNPNQEIAHFNLGWLLLIDDPEAAATHFHAAAELVPDKGGVYFGLGLALRNQGTRAAAAGGARALALECLNDPLFLTSPWWRQPAIAALRPAAMAALHDDCDRVARQLDARRDPRSHDARWIAALADWIDGKDQPGEMLGLAHTSQRVQYFVGRPARPDFAGAGNLTYRRERKAYPILMRQPDLPPPVDLYDVQENALAAREFRFLFPAKGWLPGRVLPGLLDAPESDKP